MKRGGSANSSGGLLPRLHHGSSHPALSSGSGGAHHPERAAAHPARVARIEDICRGLLATLCHWLLVQFAGLQDAVLAIASLRRVVSFALTPRCRAAVLSRLLPPARNAATWDTIGYHVADDARRLLLHGSLHGLACSPEVASSLPAVGRILLQTGARNTARFQQAVGAALAHQLGASLLVIDDALLKGVSKASLGGEALDAGEAGAGGGLLTLLLSFFLSGGKMAFVWDVVAQVVSGIDGPLVVLVQNVETTLCSTYERWAAFEAAMGGGGGSDDETGSSGIIHRPLVLLGGCGLSYGAAAAPQASGKAAPAAQSDEDRSVHGGAAGSSGDPNSQFPPGADDSLASLLPSAAELGLSIAEERPNARKVLAQLFPTRVRLQPPADAATAARHAQQLQADAVAATAEHNFRTLSSLAAARNISVPPQDAAIYADQRLAPGAWAKVLAWAVNLEAARARMAIPLMPAEPADSKQPQPSEQETHPAGSPTHAGAAAQNGPAYGAPLRRCSSASGTAGGFLPPGSFATQPASPRHSKAGGSRGGSGIDGGTQSASLLAGLAARLTSLAKPSSAGMAATQPAVETSSGSASSSSGTAASTAQPSNQLALAADNPAASIAEPSGSRVAAPAVLQLTEAAKQHGCQLVISEAALRYGMTMLQRAGGGLRPNVQVDNAYERRLLAEVIQPEDAGAGFREVGALSAAKEALREAVQLPLQHPALFARGSLARPCRGVLLFGPPGNGKTLLARAAAAECGAAFLAISPSTLASKWLGDGVRYTRALFSLAAKLSPCVIFIDEVDALLGRRNSHSEHEALREMKNELMAQWDGIRSGAAGPTGPRIMVLGATNRPGDLDEAVLRRFSRRLLCDLPDRAARAAILRVILEGEALAADVDVDAIAAATDGYSGSDLRQLCASAAMRPVRELLAASGKSAKTAKGGKSDKAAKTAEASEAAAPDEAAAAADSSSSSSSSFSIHSMLHDTSSGGMQNGIKAAAEVPAVPAAAFAAADAPAADDAAAIVPTANGTIMPAAGGDPSQTDKLSATAAAANSSTAESETASGDALLGRLLAECEAVAAEADAAAPAELRPVDAADFVAAQRDVAPSVAPDSGTMAELRAWDAQYGEGGARGAWNPKLSYFI